VDGIVLALDAFDGGGQPGGNGLIVDVARFEREYRQEHRAWIIDLAGRLLHRLEDRLIDGQPLLRGPQALAHQIQQFVVGELPAEIDLDQERLAVVLFGQGRGQPVVQFGAARLGEGVDLHVEAFFAFDDFFFDQALFGQFGQRAVDLTLVGRPEMLHRAVEGFFQVIACERGVGEESEDGVF